MKFLCDEMLVRLGRWVRAAGYDTAIAAPGIGDGALLRQAKSEDRVLLTCDGHLAAYPGKGREVHLLPADGVEAQVRALNRQFAVDWLKAPFSCCVVDNAILRPARPEERERAPPRARALGGAFLTCP